MARWSPGGIPGFPALPPGDLAAATASPSSGSGRPTCCGSDGLTAAINSTGGGPDLAASLAPGCHPQAQAFVSRPRNRSVHRLGFQVTIWDTCLLCHLLRGWAAALAAVLGEASLHLSS